jgi:hypothetical protein
VLICKACFNFWFDVGSGNGSQLDVDGGSPVDGRSNSVWRWAIVDDGGR